MSNDYEKPVQESSETSDAAGLSLENISGSDFREQLKSGAERETLIALLKARKEDIIEHHGQKTYKTGNWQQTSIEAHTAHYRNIVAKIDSLLYFLQHSLPPTHVNVVKLDESVCASRVHEWNVLTTMLQGEEEEAEIASSLAAEQNQYVQPALEKKTWPRNYRNFLQEKRSDFALLETNSAMRAAFEKQAQNIETTLAAYKDDERIPEEVEDTKIKRGFEQLDSMINEAKQGLEVLEVKKSERPSLDDIKQWAAEARSNNPVLQEAATKKQTDTTRAWQKFEQGEMRTLPVKSESTSTKGDDGEALYAPVREKWLQSRERSAALEERYQAELENYYRTREKEKFFSKQGLSKAGYELSKVFGLKPKIPADIEALRKEVTAAGNEYKNMGRKLVEAKTVKRGGLDEKTIERYESILAYHLTKSKDQKRNVIQQEVVKELHPNGTKFGKAIERMRKYRYYRWAGTIGAYAVVGGLTGGLGAALVGGTVKAVQLARGVAAGAAGGQLMHRTYNKYRVAPAREDLESSYTRARTSIFDRDLGDVEAEIAGKQETLRRFENTRNRMAFATSALAGGLAGAIDFDSSDTADVGKNTKLQQTLPKADNELSGRLSDEYTKPNTEVPVEKVEPPMETPPLVEKTEPVPEVVEPTPSPEIKEIEPEPEVITPEPVPESQPVPIIPPSEEGVYPPEPAEPVPEPMPQPVPESAPDATPETPPAAPEVADRYVVKAGDNTWNIMEGSGPDTSPTGGRSEVIKDMSLHDRRHALDLLFDYMEKDTDFTKSVGIESGDPHRIFPGNEIDVAAMDAKLEELLREGNTSPDTDALSTDIPEAEPEIVPKGVTPDAPQFAPPIDGYTYASNETTTAAAAVTAATVPAIMPGAGQQNERNRTEVAANDNQKADPEAYIRAVIDEVEHGSGFLGLRQDTRGTYEKLKNMTLREITDIETQTPRGRDIQIQNLGISDEGWGAWIDKLNELGAEIAWDENETLAQYMERTFSVPLQQAA